MASGVYTETIDPAGTKGLLLDPFNVIEGSDPATSCITYKFYDTDTTTTPPTVPNYLSMVYPDITLTKTSAGTLTVKK